MAQELIALNMHVDVGYTYCGPNQSRSRIRNFIGRENAQEIVQSIILKWKMRARVRGLTRAPDHIPIIVQLCIPSRRPRRLRTRCDEIGHHWLRDYRRAWAERSLSQWRAGTL